MANTRGKKKSEEKEVQENKSQRTNTWNPNHKSAADEFYNRKDVQDRLKAESAILDNNVIPVLEGTPSGMGNDPRYMNVDPNYTNAIEQEKADRNRSARMSYEYRQKDPTQNVDWSSMTDEERGRQNQINQSVSYLDNMNLGIGQNDSKNYYQKVQNEADNLANNSFGNLNPLQRQSRLNEINGQNLIHDTSDASQVTSALGVWGRDDYHMSSDERKQFKSLVKEMGLKKILDPNTEAEAQESKVALQKLADVYGEEFVGNLQSTYAKTNGAIAALSGLGYQLAKPFNTFLNATGQLSNEDYADMQREQNALRDNNKVAYGAGEMAGTMTQYGSANGVLEGLGIGGNIATNTAKGLAKKTALNLGMGQGVDTLLDTIPTLRANYVMGNYNNPDGSFNTGAFAKDLAINQASNLAFNILGETGNVIQGAKDIRSFKATDDILGREATRNANDALQEEAIKNDWLSNVNDNLPELEDTTKPDNYYVNEALNLGELSDDEIDNILNDKEFLDYLKSQEDTTPYMNQEQELIDYLGSGEATRPDIDYRIEGNMLKLNSGILSDSEIDKMLADKEFGEYLKSQGIELNGSKSHDRTALRSYNRYLDSQKQIKNDFKNEWEYLGNEEVDNITDASGLLTTEERKKLVNDVAKDVEESRSSKKKFNTTEKGSIPSQINNEELSGQVANLINSANGGTENVKSIIKDINQDLSEGDTSGIIETMDDIIKGDYDESLKDEAKLIKSQLDTSTGLGDGNVSSTISDAISDAKLSDDEVLKAIANAQSDAERKRILASYRDGKPIGIDMSDEAKEIFGQNRNMQWDTLSETVNTQKENIQRINDEWVSDSNVSNVLEESKGILDKIASAKTPEQARQAYNEYFQKMNSIRKDLMNSTKTHTIEDVTRRQMYDHVISNLKGKKIYVDKSTKAEFPDGVFNMNRFGHDINFVTNPDGALNLDTVIDELKDQTTGYIQWSDNEKENIGLLLDFLDKNKKNDVETLVENMDSEYLSEQLIKRAEEIYTQKLEMLGYPNGKKTSISKGYTNTLFRSNQLTDSEIAKWYNPDDFTHADTTWKQTLEDAQNLIKTRGVDSEVEKILNKENFTSAVDVDEGMQLHKILSDKARSTDSDEDWARAVKVMNKVIGQGSQSAEILNAMKKWSLNTPEGQFAYSLAQVRKAVDIQRTKGFSSAVDNMLEQVNDAISNAKTTDEAIKSVKELLNMNLQFFGAKGSYKIKNVDKIIDILKTSEDLPTINLQDKVSKAIRDQLGAGTLTVSEQKKILKMFYDAEEVAKVHGADSRLYNEALGKAAKEVQKHIPSSLANRIKSIIYDNMLASLKTMVTRNAGSNAIYNSLEDITNPEKVFADWVTGKFTKRRTRALSGQAIVEGAKGLAKGTGDTLLDIGKHVDTVRSGEENIDDIIRNANTAFKRNSDNKFVNGVDVAFGEYDRLVKKFMELGDRPFYEKQYAATKTELQKVVDKYGEDGLRKGLDMNKIDSSNANIDDIINYYARQEALAAVMQNKSEISEGMTQLRDAIGQLSRGLFAGADVLSTTATPFVQVPGNIVARGLEYTPLGLVNNIAKTVREGKKYGAINQRRFTNEITHNINGLALLGGAIGLASKGKISGAYSSDPDEKAQQINDGYQEYAYQWVDKNGVTHQRDLSDIPVLGGKLQAGKDVYDLLQEEGINPATLGKATMSELEAMVGNSLFEGLNRLTGNDSSYTSGGISTIPQNLANTVASGITALVPSAVRQSAQFSDPYKRDLGDYKTTDYYINSLRNAIPGNFLGFGRESLDTKYNNEGGYVLQNQGKTGLDKFVEDFINPYTETTLKYSDLTKEAERLSSETGNYVSFMPTLTKGDLTKTKGYKADEYKRSDYLDLKNTAGDINTEIGTALIKNETYNNMSAEDQEKALQAVYSAAKAIAKEDAVRSQYNQSEIPKLEEDGTIYTSNDNYAKAYREGGVDAVIKLFDDENILKSYGMDKSNSKVWETIQDGDIEYAEEYATGYNIAHNYDINFNTSVQNIYDICESDAEFEDLCDAVNYYDVSLNSNTSDLYFNMGDEGLEIYSELPRNDNNKVTLENSVKYMYEHNYSEEQIGKVMYSITDMPKETSKQYEYWANQNYIAIARHYKKKYKIDG